MPQRIPSRPSSRARPCRRCGPRPPRAAPWPPAGGRCRSGACRRPQRPSRAAPPSGLSIVRYATCASSRLASRPGSCPQAIGAAFAPDPLDLPFGLGLSAPAPPPRYSRHHRFSGLEPAIPRRSIASVLDMPPSATALAAVALVLQLHPACVLLMFSSPSLPTARYVCCHFRTALAGMPRLLATDSCPRPATNAPAAGSLTDRSCLHRRSMDMESLPSLGPLFPCPRNGRQFTSRIAAPLPVLRGVSRRTLLVAASPAATRRPPCR